MDAVPTSRLCIREAALFFLADLLFCAIITQTMLITIAETDNMAPIITKM